MYIGVATNAWHWTHACCWLLHSINTDHKQAYNW